MHAKRRCYERYDTELTKEMHNKLIKSFQKNIGVISANRESNSKTNVVIKFEEKYFRFIYDRNNNVIVTFLPMCDD